MQFLLGACFLALFHFESVTVGPVKISHLWKGILLVCLLIYLKIKPSVYTPLFLLSSLCFFSIGFFYDPVDQIFYFLTSIIIPLIGIYSLQKPSYWSKKSLYFLSVFFILAFLPYEIGLISSIKQGYDLYDSYGFDLKGLIGPFQTTHSASTALAGALLVILYFLITATYNRFWLIFLFAIGVYFLINTYARTGIAMFAVGSILLLSSIAIRNRIMFLRITLILLVTIPSLIIWLIPNEGLMARIQGQRINSTETSSIETLGSGRGLLANLSLKIYSEATVIEKVFGMGVTEQRRRMGEMLGSELIPHNGFLGVLIHFGVAGLFLFIWFLIAFWKSIARFPDPKEVAFLRSLFAGYVVMTFLQQQDMLYHFTLMMLAYSWKRKEADELIY